MSIASKVLNMLAFGTLGPVDDSGPVQTAQIAVGNMEIQDRRPMISLFGIATNPPLGSDTVVVYPGGERSRGVVIGVNHQATRPRGQAPGETTVFNAFGMTAYFSKNGILVQSGGKPITIDGQGQPVKIIGDLNVTGEVTAKAGTGQFVTLTQHLQDGQKPTPGT